MDNARIARRLREFHGGIAQSAHAFEVHRRTMRSYLNLQSPYTVASPTIEVLMLIRARSLVKVLSGFCPG
jgi:hypothetical protein